ncbi:hypothetical protein B4U80_15030 [Leptotrombidium deliense]|uniref:Uncharacterized protein n=1 Tax=Leptotrombidium deliense TaxID=299467 RepID=A0A443RSY6_9ACAR|nr:hypothetical protein B4U80_15030 [Leptotrombidium deliense]
MSRIFYFLNDFGSFQRDAQNDVYSSIIFVLKKEKGFNTVQEAMDEAERMYYDELKNFQLCLKLNLNNGFLTDENSIQLGEWCKHIVYIAYMHSYHSKRYNFQQNVTVNIRDEK